MERGIDARFSALPRPIRSLWNADTCPVELLPWLAWAVSVDVWDDSWDEDRKRAAIRESLWVHLHKGTVAAVRRALGAIGVELTITEWFEAEGVANAMPPYTFRLTAFAEEIFVGGFGINHAFLDVISEAIDHVKPLRASYHVRVGDAMRSDTYVRSGTRSRAYSRLTLEPAARADETAGDAALRSGTRQRCTSRITHDILRKAA